MIRLTRAPDLLMAQHWANLLQQAGIPCRLSGIYLQGGAGELPVDQCGPDVWLENASDQEAALRIIDGREALGVAPQHAWQCDHCGEWLEPQFSECWQCGASRPFQAVG